MVITIMPEQNIPKMVPDQFTSRAFFAALLEANKSTCECKCVKILRKMSAQMTKEFDEV